MTKSLPSRCPTEPSSVFDTSSETPTPRSTLVTLIHFSESKRSPISRRQSRLTNSALPYDQVKELSRRCWLLGTLAGQAIIGSKLVTSIPHHKDTKSSRKRSATPSMEPRWRLNGSLFHQNLRITRY